MPSKTAAERITEPACKFDQGYFCACENLVTMFDEPSVAGELLEQLGSLNAEQIKTLIADFESKRPPRR